MMHPDDYADERTGYDLHQRHISFRMIGTILAVGYIGTLTWIGHVAWLIAWASQ